MTCVHVVMQKHQNGSKNYGTVQYCQLALAASNQLLALCMCQAEDQTVVSATGSCQMTACILE